MRFELRQSDVRASDSPISDSPNSDSPISDSLGIARFRFNAWAKYPDWELDDRVPDLLAERLGVRAFPIRYAGRDVVLEGGAIDVNGAGTVLTTEECLLDQQVQVRNPGLGRADMETVLRESLGVRHVIWLGGGIVRSKLYGVTPDDPMLHLTAAAALIAVVFLATLRAAWRASRANPVDVLRAD